MATRRWVGGAAPVAQVRSWLFAGTWLSTETITVTIGSKAVTVLTGSATIATILANLVTAYNALSATLFPEMAEQTASNDSTHFLLTAATAGKPFACTLSTNSALGTIDGSSSSTGTDTTASSGPNDVGVAKNWSGATLPVSTDDVVLDDGTFSLLYSLSALSAVSLNSLTIYASFATPGVVGLAAINNDATAYPEYRPQYLQIGAATVSVGQGDGDGSDRIKLDTGSVAATLNVYKTGSGQDNGLPAMLWKGTSASNVANVLGTAELGVAAFGGESANLSGGLNLTTGATVLCGAGTTLATVNNDGGTLTLYSAVGTALNQVGGSTTLYGSGAVAQLTCDGGTVTYNTPGTLGGNTVLTGDAYLDFSQDRRSKTVTNPVQVYGPAAAVNDPYQVVSGLVVDYEQIEVVINGGSLGFHVKVTRGTPP